ncbi:unnamed protein product, partial [Mesorhabditis belari]|uniref:Uncharacterized protein n=1 Tax=Mesorhabditis belari TaxID=2138241 RepID=A0AAF3J1B6_9BILA
MFLFQVLSFLTALLSCETLRLCQQGETENCLLDVPRLEIRQLDALQRKHLINAFRGEKMQHKRKEWERILEGDLAHDLIRRLDDRLSIEGFFTPYWDSRIDRRLAKPEDSTLFHDDFLPRQLSRKERATKQNERRKDSHPLADIRKTKNSQLFFVLHEVAKAKRYINESCASLCAIKNDWLFCDRQIDRCVATISLGTMDALEELIHEADQILNAVTTIEPGKAERRRTFRNLFIKPLDDELIGVQKESPELEIALSLPTEIPHKAVYSIHEQGSKVEEMIDVIAFKPMMSTTEPKVDMDEADDVPVTLREESSTPYFQDVPISKIPIATRLPQKGSPLLTGEYLPRKAILFDAPAPFPTVYFTVTVVEGEYRKRNRRQRFASGVTAFTTGANMPSGYTHTFEGKSLNGTTMLRALDPHVAGILTEFNVTVVDSRGFPCQQMCKHEAKNSYRPCPTDVIRLSTFAQYADDIPIYQNSLEASQAAWLGQGYFRRRKADYLVYKCRSEKRMRKREKQSP